MTRYVILAARCDEWPDAACKHLQLVHGVPLLYRLLQQLAERGQSDVHLAGWHHGLTVESYRPSIVQQPDADIDILSSRERWSETDRTVVLFGDVWFTDQAIDAIIAFDSPRYQLFCRPGPNAQHLYPHGEIFAAAFHPDAHEFLDYNLNRMPHLLRADILHRVGTWELTRLMARIPLDELHRHQTALESYVVIDDATNDIDDPTGAALIERATQ